MRSAQIGVTAEDEPQERGTRPAAGQDETGDWRNEPFPGSTGADSAGEVTAMNEP
jgi:hypothetical protein